jgi:hypothetical protein
MIKNQPIRTIIKKMLTGTVEIIHNNNDALSCSNKSDLYHTIYIAYTRDMNNMRKSF